MMLTTRLRAVTTMTSRTSGIEIEALVASHRRLFTDMCLVYERAWVNPGSERGFRFLRDHAATRGLSRERDVARRWGVAEASMRPTRYGDAPRFDDAGSHPLTARLADHMPLLIDVEDRVIEIGRRLASWFGAPPGRFDWVVVCGAAPQIGDLGYWLNTAAWSVELALECDDIPVELEFESVLPKLWCETIVSDLQWEVAAGLGMTVPRNYRPPSAIADQPFARLESPFRAVLDLWSCGVMLSTSFLDSQTTATLFVHSGAILEL